MRKTWVLLSVLASTVSLPDANGQSHYSFVYDNDAARRIAQCDAGVYADSNTDANGVATDLLNASYVGVQALAQLFPALCSVGGTSNTLTVTQPKTERLELHLLGGISQTYPWVNFSGGDGFVSTSGFDRWTIVDQREPDTAPTPLNGVNVQLIVQSTCFFEASGEIRRNGVPVLQYFSDINGTVVGTIPDADSYGDLWFLGPGEDFFWTFPAAVGDIIELGALNGGDTNDGTTFWSYGLFGSASPYMSGMACDSVLHIKMDMLDSLAPTN